MLHIIFLVWVFVLQASGHAGIVEWLLSAGADVTVKDKKGNTALNDAVLGQRDQVAELIRQKFPAEKIQLPPYDIGDLMCKEAFNGNLDKIQRLILYGAHVDAANYDGRTALMLAAGEGHVHLVEYLLDMGANLGAVDRSRNLSKP